MDPLDRSWNLWTGIVVAGGIAAIAALAFVVVPIVEYQGTGIDAFTAICRAIGIAAGGPAPAAASRAQPATRVAWTAPAFAALAKADKPAGATVAQGTCVACHTAEGPSADPSIPALAGQSEFAIYKELMDFKSGARANDVMSPIAQSLEPKQIVDVAAYYAGLVRRDIDAAHPSFAGPGIEALAVRGDVARRLPPCGACHTAAGGPIETPSLAGQPAAYVTAELQAFASGKRHNDAFERMRVIAAKLTSPEMALLGAYYTTPH